MQHPYFSMKAQYEQWAASAVITNRRGVDEAVHICERHLDYYVELGEKARVPADLLVALDYREDNCDPTRGIGQGDRWNRVSVNVPRGKGPFVSKLEADLYYIKYDALDKPPEQWNMPAKLYKGNAWNGWGYTAHGIRSPYIVGGTNLQQRGKYTSDGHYDPSHMDEQIGILPIMLELGRKHPDLFGSIPIIAAPPPLQPVEPLPADFVGAHDTKALQHALNALKAVPAAIAPLDEDGNYGRRTEAAVRAFQRAHGLDVDGIAGPLTIDAINAALRVAGAEPVA